MGIQQRTIRFFGCEGGEEEEESSEKPCCIPASLYKIFKNLLHQIFSFRFFRKIPRESDPIIPVKNPLVSGRYNTFVQEISSPVFTYKSPAFLDSETKPIIPVKNPPVSGRYHTFVQEISSPISTYKSPSYLNPETEAKSNPIIPVKIPLVSGRNHKISSTVATLESPGYLNPETEAKSNPIIPVKIPLVSGRNHKISRPVATYKSPAYLNPQTEAKSNPIVPVKIPLVSGKNHKISSPVATYKSPAYLNPETEAKSNPIIPVKITLVSGRKHSFVQEISSPVATYKSPAYLNPETEAHIASSTSACVSPADLESQRDQKVKTCLVSQGGKWIKHYNSNHRILLVGEGDFSFSACLALAFGSAPHMIATSLNSAEFLKNNYKNAMINIQKLTSRKSRVMHEIDAANIASHPFLGEFAFDRIIFNFPHAGFFPDLSRKAVLRKHRRLVSLFLMNAKEIVSEKGEIHISHKTNGFHKEWNLESMASSHGLKLIEAVEFNLLDYPGYYTKYGFGGDNNFNCYPSKTYKFRLERQN